MPKRSAAKTFLAVFFLSTLLFISGCGEKGSAPGTEPDGTVSDTANGGMTPSEETITDGALSRNLPGLGQVGVETDLTIYLADRFGRYNNLKKGISVHIVTENGLATNTGYAQVDGVTVVEADDAGRAVVKLRTQTGLNNIDSTAAANAWETSLAATVLAYPSWFENRAPSGWPGQSIVSVLYYTRGEEEFDDANDNGRWDTGEAFVDTPDDPFLDSNENGVFDPLEKLIDVNGDGVYSGPNGLWDSNKMIYRNTHFTVTGRPRIGVSANRFDVPDGGSVTLNVIVCDDNFQRISSNSTVAITLTTGKLLGTAEKTYSIAYTPAYNEANQLVLIQFPLTIKDPTPGTVSTTPDSELSIVVTWEGETITHKIPGTVL